MKKKWKIILIVLCMLPLAFFSASCSCSKENNNSGGGYNQSRTYTVAFYTNTESVFNIPSQEVKEGECARDPRTNPNVVLEKEGEYFVGWYTSLPTINENNERVWDQNTLWSFLTPITKDIQLYARWEPTGYS